MAEFLEKQATVARLHQLAQQGFLDAQALERASEILGALPSKSGWQKLLNMLLLFLGVALVLAGIIFFFAYHGTMTFAADEWQEPAEHHQIGVR